MKKYSTVATKRTFTEILGRTGPVLRNPGGLLSGCSIFSSEQENHVRGHWQEPVFFKCSLPLARMGVTESEARRAGGKRKEAGCVSHMTKVIGHMVLKQEKTCRLGRNVNTGGIWSIQEGWE